MPVHLLCWSTHPRWCPVSSSLRHICMSWYIVVYLVFVYRNICCVVLKEMAMIFLVLWTGISSPLPPSSSPLSLLSLSLPLSLPLPPSPSSTFYSGLHEYENRLRMSLVIALNCGTVGHPLAETHLIQSREKCACWQALKGE